MAVDDLGKGLAAVSGQKRMTPERLAEARRGLELRYHQNPYWAKDALTELLAHIDALTLERATRVEDGEVAGAIARLRGAGPGSFPLEAGYCADLLSRLSSALASAERDRRESRALALEEAAKVCESVGYHSTARDIRALKLKE